MRNSDVIDVVVAKHSFVPMALLAALLLIAVMPLAPSAVTCGVEHSGTGTCSGGVKILYSSAISMLPDGCCGSVSGCGWDYIGNSGSCVCNDNAPNTVDCGDFDDNIAGCNAFSSIGCKWAHASSTAACGGSPNGNGYGEACTGPLDCATCLACVSGKCTQRPGICTAIPAEYVAPTPGPALQGTGIDPALAIADLESGNNVSGSAVMGSESGIYKVGWFSDWKVTGLIGVAIVCSIIALAAMIGTAFNLPAIKAFANTEIKQAAISALIIVSLIALVTFFNVISLEAVNAADLPVGCGNSEPCHITAAKYYLTTLQNTSNEYANNTLSESINIAKRASYGQNLNFNTIKLLFAGVSVRENAGDSLVAERYGAMFAQASKMIASLSAQKYFIDVITFGVAPLFILLGVVLRTFFFTRKLGGLLLALAISLFFIYPLTFVFAWYTLNVTVYGERTLAVSDPNCPPECTGTYPVAFFTNSNGELVQFSTTQAIMRAGINRNNWGSGGPGSAFPGLVACKNLSSINIPASVAPNTCGSCPDYCRDVPFPTSMPGCNISACAECNPGCKIVRQRDCQTDLACAGACPDICRTKIPLENKCFDNEKGGVIAANLSANCSGCSKYPAWCRFLRNESGNLSMMYTDNACKFFGCKNGNGVLAGEIYGTAAECADACEMGICVGVNVSSDPTCPVQCSYTTSIGMDDKCDSICSVAGTVCPEACRVLPFLNDASWSGMYDLAPVNFQNFTKFCNSTPQIGAACAKCAAHPECLVTARAPDKLPSSCAPYPVNDVSQLCLDCPDYCRRNDFTDVFTDYSAVDRSASGLPSVCNPLNVPGMNCSASGAPACSPDCRMNDVPPTCRAYSNTQSTDGDIAFCRGCPDNARYQVMYIKHAPLCECMDGEPISCNSQAAPAGGYNTLLSNPSPAVSTRPANAGGSAGKTKLAGADEGGDGAIAGASGIGGTIMLAGASGGTIRLAEPSISTISARINPSNPYSATPALNGYCTGTGDDGIYSGAPSGDAIQFRSATIGLAAIDIKYEYKWYLNNEQHSEGSTCFLPSGVEVFVSAINGSFITGNTWTFSCRAFTGAASGSWTNSTEVTIQGEPACTVTNSTISLAAEAYHCGAENCPVSGPPCQALPIYVELPNEDDDSACGDAATTGCPYGCRVIGLDDFLSPDCAILCEDMPETCFVSQPTVPICNEYLGNGPASCHGGTCTTFNSESTCMQAGTGCDWNSDYNYCDKVACIDKPQNLCTGDCKWMGTANLVPIEDRSTSPIDYGDRTNCKQCPEQCRLNGYTGSCGVANNTGDVFVDCSLSSCPATCRISEPKPPASPLCQPYPESSGQACADCPALCRRKSNFDTGVDSCQQYPGCVMGTDPAKGCTDECGLENPPEKACEGCMECDMDCTYYPAIRTDCSDICSDEALAGPVNIAPNDFVKSLPGAQTAYTDVKNIGALYIPAVVLPLFSIVMVVAFVRIFSPMLGGDIEIPGLGRII